MQLADLPSGWKATPPSPSSGDAAKQAALISCVGGKNTHSDQLSKVEKTYVQGNNEISSNAARFRSRADVAADTALLRRPKVNSCYQQAARKQLTSSLPSGTKLEAVAITITPGSGSGPPNVVGTGRGTVTISRGAQTVTIYLDVAFITGPRVEAEVDFTTVGARIDPGVRQRVIANVATRAARG